MTGVGCMMAGVAPGAIIALVGDADVTDFQIAVAAIAKYKLTSAGVESSTEQATETVLGTYCTPTSQAPQYEVRATLNSGALTSGTTGSWLALSSNREWVCQSTGGSGIPVRANLTIEIRRTGSTTVLASCTVDLDALSSGV